METGHVNYRVQFGSADAVTAAADRLVRAGFAVTPQPDDADGFALEASMTAEVDRADDALAQALSGIDHDPVIEWHVARFTGFVQPS
jgi:hypothetical protein